MSVRKRRPKRYVKQGDEFDRLKVEGLDTERTVVGVKFFWCKCKCGTRLSVRAASLTSGNTQSCGCIHREHIVKLGQASGTHRKSHTKVYHCYENIKKRCYDPKCDMFYRYGGRGVVMCSRWFASRSAFFDDMGDPPTPKHSIDRIDTNGGYWCGSPDCNECGPLGRIPNCRWATDAEQSVNRSNNRMITYQGRTLALVQWSAELGISYRVLQVRIDVLKWPIDRAFTEPVNSRLKRSGARMQTSW